MRTIILLTFVVSLIGIFIISPLAFAEDDTSDEDRIRLPGWIKDIAKMWHDGRIGDETFVGTVEWLIDNKIIVITDTDAKPDTTDHVPAWVKNNAGWWASGQINDQTFVNGLQYLIQIGLIQVQQGGGGGGGGY